jgi:hypothetical protein
MTKRDVLDNLIRSTIRSEVAGLEPSPAVRDTLLAAAAHSHPLRSAGGPTMPALIEGLCENVVDDNRPRRDPEIVLSAWHHQWWLLTARVGMVR